MKLNKIYIEITNQCNLACTFCSKSNLKKQNMSVNEFAHIIHEIKSVTNNIYLHVKGEPLLHPQLKEILTLCEENKIRVNITSNGTLVQKHCEMLATFSCIKKMNFSLHCEQKDPEYLEKLFACVETLKPNKTIIYRLWTMKENGLDDISKNIIDRLMQYYHLEINKKEELMQKQNIKISDNVYVDKDNEFVWPSLDNDYEKAEGYCYALKTHVAILANGDVVPCCLDGEGVIHLGNIHTQSMESIMQSERYQKLKKSFQDRKPCELLCKKCQFKNRFNI